MSLPSLVRVMAGTEIPMIDGFESFLDLALINSKEGSEKSAKPSMQWKNKEQNSFVSFLIGLFFQDPLLNSRASKLKIFAKLKDIWLNSRVSHLNFIFLHLKLNDFFSKLKDFSAKPKEFTVKLKISTNSNSNKFDKTLKKQKTSLR